MEMKMRKMSTSILLFTLAWFGTATGLASAPLSLHPENPRYFQFRGEPAVLITSGEHYGAVINLNFDYLAYLDELARHGFNHTRLFSGTYREIPGSFNIQDNTLAPAPHRYAGPWARSDTPGYFDGGNKFDLTRWDEAYFTRLKDFVRQAGKRGIVVDHAQNRPGAGPVGRRSEKARCQGVGKIKTDSQNEGL
jgi:hypothetical protein